MPAHCLRLSSLVFSLLMFALVDRPAGRASAAEIDFERDVAPIFSARCLECHGDDAPEGGLRLTGRKHLLQRGDSGRYPVVAGSSQASELLRRVTASGEERMPPDGERLSADEIERLRQWIDAGADWPADPTEATHWAYRKPVTPPLPPVQQPGWLRNEIDAFVLATLERQHPPLEPSPAADPARLLRRVFLDLIGLPPSVEEVDAFLADPSTAHYEEIVDRLLQSPRYGEKWARQWLDLARYADSNGFQADQFRSMWAYRDWVIRAMNVDMPFDEFTMTQLAGDLFPEATIADKTATGFQRCTTCNVEAGVDPEENRVNQVIDRVNTFGMVWLGTTLECAQCHNHKYDPFTQQDYYQLFAFFNNTPLEVELPNGKGVSYEVAGPKMELPLPEEAVTRLTTLQQQRDEIEGKLAARQSELAALASDWEAGLRGTLSAQAAWHDTEITSFVTTSGAAAERRDDGSLLITGPVPDQDVYTVTIDTRLAQISGLKVEMLADETLPQRGPGRAGPRPNAIINELELTVSAPGDEMPRRLGLHSAQAGYSQPKWDVSGAIDGDPKSGWAINPKFGQDHWASFLLTESVGNAEGLSLTLTIQQNYGGGRTIGRLRVSLMTGDPGAVVVPEDVRALLAKPAEQRSRQEQRQLAAYQADSDDALAALQQQRTDIEQQIAAVKPETTLIMVEMPQPRETMIFKRGNFLDPLDVVRPATPEMLHPLVSTEETSAVPNRLALAKWVASEENPLVARVAVNRWWGEFFGQGIVSTPEDFGSQGERPTHPELLDWLAVEFMNQNWSMKHIHRLIVTSATYQQDARVTAALLAQDPYNKLLARGPRFRLPAEAIRDNGLAIAGLLSTRMGGPPVYPPQPPNVWRHVGRNAPKYDTDTDEDRFRRGIYVVWRRSAPYPSFVNFDAPDRGACVVHRSRTNTPLQALTLLNDPAYVEMAHALAERLEADRPGLTDRERIEYGFRLCTARQPTTEEVTTLLSLLTDEIERWEVDPAGARALTGGDARGRDPVRMAAWFFVASALLNLDETVTRG